MIFHGSVMAEIMRLHAEIERLEAELAAFKRAAVRSSKRDRY
jgi:uncharacterized small protein (DUF1192 family)